MAKKILTCTVIGEMEIDTVWYNNMSEADIKRLESNPQQLKQWLFDNIKNIKVSLKKA